MRCDLDGCLFIYNNNNKAGRKKNKFVHSTMLGENVLCGFRLSFIVTSRVDNINNIEED